MEKDLNFATDNKDGRKLPDNVPETNVGKINGRTQEEIILAMECCNGKYSCEKCPYDFPKNDGELCNGQPMTDALALVNYLKDRCDRLEYTLVGVMHSVDKWLDVEPYDFDKDDGTVAATRAATAREVALKAIEKARKDLVNAKKDNGENKNA